MGEVRSIEIVAELSIKAIDASSADVLKAPAGYRNVHIRAATVGNRQSTLSEPPHFKILGSNQN
jgi:hypothetical protein